MQAVVEQVQTLQHTSALYANQPQSDLAEKLAQITPGRLKKSFFTSSGTEANDTAIMAAKTHTGRHEIVVLRHSYSGRSATALSAVRACTPGGRCPRRCRASSMRTRPTATAAPSS